MTHMRKWNPFSHHCAAVARKKSSSYLVWAPRWIFCTNILIVIASFSYIHPRIYGVNCSVQLDVRTKRKGSAPRPCERQFSVSNLAYSSINYCVDAEVWRTQNRKPRRQLTFFFWEKNEKQIFQRYTPLQRKDMQKKIKLNKRKISKHHLLRARESERHSRAPWYKHSHISSCFTCTLVCLLLHVLIWFVFVVIRAHLLCSCFPLSLRQPFISDCTVWFCHAWVVFLSLNIYSRFFCCSFCLHASQNHLTYTRSEHLALPDSVFLSLSFFFWFAAVVVDVYFWFECFK